MINSSRALQRFGDLCCFAGKVERAGISLSIESNVYCMGFVLMWHLRVADTAVGDLARYMHGLTQNHMEDHMEEGRYLTWNTNAYKNNFTNKQNNKYLRRQENLSFYSTSSRPVSRVQRISL